MDSNIDRERDDYRSEVPPQGGDFAPGDYFNSAMRSALFVGIGFVLQALALVFWRLGLLSSLLYLVGLILVPVLLFVRAKNHFEVEAPGPVPYLTASAYLFWTLMLSLIIAALVLYGAFYLLLHDPAFLETLEQTMTQMEALVADKEMAESLREAFAGMTPKSMTLNTTGSYFFFGTVYVYIAAIFLRKAQ